VTAERPRNRAERRALREKYRRVDVSATCDQLVADPTLPLGVRPCGPSMTATFVVERGDPVPAVTFRHNPDGSHEPVLGGTGIAATARRMGRVVSKLGGSLDGNSN
jgi:hypothetical protein